MDYSFKELMIGEVQSQRIKSFYDYWCQQKRSRRYPSLFDLDLDSLPGMREYLMVAAISYPPFRVSYDFVGEQIIYFYKRDFTGEYLHEIFEGNMLRHYEVPHRIAMMRPEPLLGVESWPGTQISFEWGVFPVSDDGERVNYNLVIEDYSGLDLNDLTDVPYKLR